MVGDGPATAAAVSTRSGRSASSSEVSTCPACRSPAEARPRRSGHQATTSRPSPTRMVQARDHRLVTAAVAVDEHHAATPTRPSAPARRGRLVIAAVPIESVPGKPWCSPLAVIVTGGATSARCARAAAPRAIAVAISVSVPIGRWWPCCSHVPRGTSSTGSAGELAPGEVRELGRHVVDGTAATGQRSATQGCRTRRSRRRAACTPCSRRPGGAARRHCGRA